MPEKTSYLPGEPTWIDLGTADLGLGCAGVAGTPGAVLGVRSGRVFRRLAGDTWVPIAQSPQQEAGRQEARRTYPRQMDVDLRLVEIESKVPFEGVHVLSREEIAELGIDSR